MNNNTEHDELLAKLHSETASIAWRELELFFARGVVIEVHSELDLVQVACMLVLDNSGGISELMNKKHITPPTATQARQWHKDNTVLWTVVVSPFVLVQQK